MWGGGTDVGGGGVRMGGGGTDVGVVEELEFKHAAEDALHVGGAFGDEGVPTNGGAKRLDVSVRSLL
jgi:hypothetical protein